MKAKLLKSAAVKCQFLCAKVQLILVPPYFRLEPPHFGCSGDGTAHSKTKLLFFWQRCDYEKYAGGQGVKIQSVVPKPGGDGGDISPNNLAVSPPIIWKGVQLSVNLGKKVFFSCWRPFFFGLHLKSGRKSVLSLEKTFFFLFYFVFFGLHLKSGRKSVLFLEKTFFFLVFTWIRGEKVFCFHFSFGLQ